MTNSHAWLSAGDGYDVPDVGSPMSARKVARALRAANNSSRAKYRASKNGTGTGEGLPRAGSLDRCWCGEGFGHDWPGRSEGEVHPR